MCRIPPEDSNTYTSAALAEVALQAMLIGEEVSHIYNSFLVLVTKEAVIRTKKSFGT
jgi:hypothetical protein